MGTYGFIRCLLERMWYWLLSIYFKFDPWHIKGAFSCRPYKNVVVELINSLQPTVVVEVGCGLGELLSHVTARYRAGYDIDQGVIRAARFIHRHIEFICGDARQIKQKNIDALIMVNWIHEISPEALENLIIPLLVNSKYLLLDAIDSGAPDSYKYKHNFKFLVGKAVLISVTRSDNESRSFHLFKVA